jgi:amino-acid N-acetyltransferase
VPSLPPRAPDAAAPAVRRARTSDVRAISRLVEMYTADRTLLAKDVVTLYEDVPEFLVAEAGGGVAGAAVPGVDDGEEVTGAGGNGAAGGGVVVGCGALHVLWEDLAEVRTLAVDPAWRGRGVGHRLLTRLLDVGRELGVRRVFCLTFEVPFFRAHGFTELHGPSVPPDVYAQMLRSHDEGVAEFLDLARVKPNTLGNTRMIREL